MSCWRSPSGRRVVGLRKSPKYDPHSIPLLPHFVPLCILEPIPKLLPSHDDENLLLKTNLKSNLFHFDVDRILTPDSFFSTFFPLFFYFFSTFFLLFSFCFSFRIFCFFLLLTTEQKRRIARWNIEIARRRGMACWEITYAHMIRILTMRHDMT
jgi:hypothetical protein